MDSVLHAGRVLDADGRGVADALVAVARGTAPTPEVAVRADADGWFRIALPPGEFQIEAGAPDGRKGRTTVATNGGTVDVRIVVEAEP